jgi:UDP:flavonoid glycosyltransferase YjiC (YdhE family)
MPRIVFAVFGSLGDLHPALGLGRELAARGHSVAVATHGIYRSRVETVGLEFHAVRPDLAELGDVREVMKRAIDARGGSEYVVRRMVLPFTRASYQDLLPICEGADAVIDNAVMFAAPLVAEKLGIPRIHMMLQPYVLFSVHDPPVLSSEWTGSWMASLPSWASAILWSMARAHSRPWFREVDALRAEVGLPRSKMHPLIGAHSSFLNLAMFSRELAKPQPDWPDPTAQTGFCFYDLGERGKGIDDRLRAFLDDGPAPLVFTLGSSGVWDAGDFYREAAQAAVLLGMRAVLLTGEELPENVPASLPDGVITAPYAAHSDLFPRAAAIVHQGGVGTTGQAMAAGRPTVVVPFSHDQPDNAARCTRLGIARVVPRAKAQAPRLARELSELLWSRATRERARVIGDRVRKEIGARNAAESIEVTLESKRGTLDRRIA